MRTLKFGINAQKIAKDPLCDFSDIVAGTKNYLKAQFSFSGEWDGCILVASFWRGNKEYAKRIIDNECIIPSEVLTGATFKVSVSGRRDNYSITTDKVTVRQVVVR